MNKPSSSDAARTSQDSARGTALDAAVDSELRTRFSAQQTAALDPTFRDALRAHLRQTVTTSVTTSVTATGSATADAANRPARRHRWPRRRTLTLAVVVAVGLGGGGAALASGVLPMPGADEVVLRAPASTAVYTGTATVDLGQRPAGVTSVELTLTCLSAGTFTFDDGASLSCTPYDVTADPASAPAPAPGLPAQHSGSAGYTLPLEPGQTTTTITAPTGSRWSLTSAYSTRTPTDWATNANGQTYGVSKDDGSQPDLIAVVAVTSTGQQGYVRASDLNPPLDFDSPQEAAKWSAAQPSTRTLPVYASDGTAVIGSFQTG